MIKKLRVLNILFSMILSGFLCVVLDLAASAMSIFIGWYWFIILLFVFTAILSLLKCKTGILAEISIILIILTCLIIFSVVHFRKNADYIDVDSGKESLYGGKKVMLIVPHQDDDLSILGGVTEEYIKYGSDVLWVFTTNGDAGGNAETRLNEAISVAASCGIPEEHVIFLGYGDGTKFMVENNLYNSPENEVFTSYCGRTETYAFDSHPAYNNGNMYTHNNMVDDLCGVILEYRPDIIFCNDYDLHPDHRATSLFLDEAMSKILHSVKDYTPLLLKSFAYSYTFYGYDDFYDSINLLSTRKTYTTEYLPESNVFNWSDRIRLPVSASTLSRYLPYTGIYKQESMYVSQGAVEQSGRVANGDRVFWLRRTDSISYSADVTCSSGNPELLNDFKIIDSERVWDETAMPFDGVWTPVDTDAEKTATFNFDVPVNISSIYLYDNPSLESNITDVLITFDNGNSYHSGELLKNGSATEINISEKNINSFTVKILSYEGDNIGLTEIEAYQEAFNVGLAFSFIKITDDASNFVYDYITPMSGKSVFQLYSVNGDISLDECEVTCSDSASSAYIEGGKVYVKCPLFSNCTLTITYEGMSDTIQIANTGILYRLGWALESLAYKNSEIFANSYTIILFGKIVGKICSII